MPLLPSQEASAFGIVTSEGFDPRDFELVREFLTSTGHLAPALVHRATGYYFAFRLHMQRAAFFVEFSPGADQSVEHYGTGTWDEVVIRKVREWLGYLRREVQAPDLWGELRREGELIAGTTEEATNTPFSPTEQAEIATQLSEMKELIRSNYQLTDSQLEAINSRLDYLTEAARRLGRLDWRQALVGSLLGLVVQALVPPEPIREVLLTIGRALGHMFGAPLELP